MYMESDMMNLIEKKSIAKALIIGLTSMKMTEEEEDNALFFLKKIVPDPAVSDYIYHSSQFYSDNGELNIDAIINKAFKYSPIAL